MLSAVGFVHCNSEHWVFLNRATCNRNTTLQHGRSCVVKQIYEEAPAHTRIRTVSIAVLAEYRLLASGQQNRISSRVPS
jgi:hypothetical protein